MAEFANILSRACEDAIRGFGHSRATMKPIHPPVRDLEALHLLVGRVLGPGLARDVTCEFLPDSGSGERYEVEGAGRAVAIRGTSASAIARGLNKYLRGHLGIHFPWAGKIGPLPDRLPEWVGFEDGACRATHRYFLNSCCFSYSLAFWSWDQWEQLIDWMALQGVNLPLAMTGQEAVWQRVCRRLGLSEREIADFLPGAAYLPFGWMGCLDGWSAPLSQNWIDRHEELGKRILARERSLGMTPVLQGFTGHIPKALLEKHPGTRHNRIHWHDWETLVLDPMDPLFLKVAGLFLEEQVANFGTNHHYAADTFIEMAPPSSAPDYLAALAGAIHQGMLATDPEAVWVLQSWAFSNQRDFWGQEQLDAFLGAVPDDRMLILDLFCDRDPQWKVTRSFSGKPWLWCNVQNFGGNTHLGASMENNTSGLREARSCPGGARLAGIGIANEALCVNPVAYDFLFDLAWSPGPSDLPSWIGRYVKQRYQGATAGALEAWHLLLECAYSCHTTHLEDSPLTRWPSLPVVECARDSAKLCRAWKLLLESADTLGPLDSYRFDLVNVGRQVLSNAGAQMKRRIQEAAASGNLEAFDSASEALLQLLWKLDALLGTREEFLLGRWLAEARKWGASLAESDLLEEEARRQITVWGKTRILRDYARKEWSGLLKDFHAGRWQMAIDWMRERLRQKLPLDLEHMEESLFEWECAWCRQHQQFPARPSGDSIEISRELFAIYGNQPKEGTGS
jgi:alpha-N-acetylglucosaminidase